MKLNIINLFFFLFFSFSTLCLMVGVKNTKFYDIIGTISVSCETFIELPQIKENCITKDTRNISGQWFLCGLLVIYLKPLIILYINFLCKCLLEELL